MSSTCIYSIDDFELKNKKVFIRTDFNIPVEGGEVKDHLRLRSALPTLRYAIERQAKVIVGSHRGRPTPDNKHNYSLEPFGYYLGRQLNCEVLFIKDSQNPVPSPLLASLSEKKMILLENLRFNPAEEQGNARWVRRVFPYIDIYINEAFSVSHRHHASVRALPGAVKQRGQGFSMKEERRVLDHLRTHPARPFVLLAGGVKVEDKVKTISQLVDLLDCVLIGGVMAFTFLKARGYAVGGAPVQTDSLKTVEEFMERLRVRGKELLLPVDHVVLPVEVYANRAGATGKGPRSETTATVSKRLILEHSCAGLVNTEGPEVPEGFVPVDIGPKTVELFSRALGRARTLFWNGPMGKFEDPAFAKGTFSICSAIAGCDGAFKVVGGGDSLSAVFKSGEQEKFDYISTGGGAALKYLQQGDLPGIQSLITRL